MFEGVGMAMTHGWAHELTRTALALPATSAPGEQGLHLYAFWSLLRS